MSASTLGEHVAAKPDPVLGRFKDALDLMYGSRIDRVVLFGSRARGDAREDYDIAVFLKSLDDRWEELDRLADLRVRLLEEIGAFFDARPNLTTAYDERTPLMREIRREGLDL
nr:nucleotidyltransferase domain-containing protein [uncultured Rhodopila sp.]